MKLREVLIILILIMAAGRIFLFHPTFSDENFYFNAARNVLNGKVPYKDFFFAHPPLQPASLALIFKFFGPSLPAGKFLSLATSSLSVFLIYLTLRELYNEKTGFVAAVIFLITPGFLAFSAQGNGMWETIFFLLLSFYFVVRGRTRESALAFIIAALFRYLALVYLPFLILMIWIREKNLKKFLINFSGGFFAAHLLLLGFFGSGYFHQTVYFHLFSKVLMKNLTKLPLQYWSVGTFFLFLAFLSAFVGYIRDDRNLMALSLFPAMANLLIFFGLKTIIYHYFLLSLPLVAMAVGRAFWACKDKFIRIAIPTILILAIVTNRPTLSYYWASSSSRELRWTEDFISSRTSKRDFIFGEPIMTNYVSFKTGREISSNYLDSYLRHLIFKGQGKVIQKLENEPPKFIIERKGYYKSDSYFRKYLQENYKLEKAVHGRMDYLIFKRKT